MSKATDSIRLRWARLRFQIIGPLLAAPPEHGALQGQLAELAAKAYRHPTTGEMIRFGTSTIERWYYTAQKHPNDPLSALARKVPSHAGRYLSLPVSVEQALRGQYKQHPRWTYQLHHDNLLALARKHPELGRVPSCSTLSRFMKSNGLVKHRRKRKHQRGNDEGEGFVAREVRSFEIEHVHGLWHSDYHVGSRRVLLQDGKWAECYLLGVLDDRSRLCCHLQWYLEQTAETFCHGLSQAIQKRGLPWALLTDNGSPMTAAETTEGLERLGILPYTTLPYTPEQNGKQESFWGQVEGRLMPMLEGQPNLTLKLLNEATHAWVELEYHRKIHDELGSSPLDVLLTEKSVGRPSPGTEHLRHAFMTEETRMQRRSDGTITVMGVRFELPQRYLSLLRPTVRFARWDLSAVDLVDPRTGTILCELLPLDKRQNADRRRRVLEPTAPTAAPPPAGIAPLLEELMAEYAATGLPPAYLPHHDQTPPTEESEEDSE